MASVQRSRQAKDPGNRRRVQNPYYVQGSTVRKLDITREIERQPKKKLSNTARKNREKAEHMNAGYVLFLSLALIATGWILVGYIRLQSDITNSIQHISKLESDLNDLRLANDEEYNRITSSIDLEEVRRIAIQELGMKYAEEGQIVTYESENSDYVKQIASIPE
ncbi:MAG: cell division protein FtsL [Ruminococcus sp.]|nr:cell division protein FtsL [Ruminococcus sp.]